MTIKRPKSKPKRRNRYRSKQKNKKNPSAKKKKIRTKVKSKIHNPRRAFAKELLGLRGTEDTIVTIKVKPIMIPKFLIEDVNIMIELNEKRLNKLHDPLLWSQEDLQNRTREICNMRPIIDNSVLAQHSPHRAHSFALNRTIGLGDRMREIALRAGAFRDRQNNAHLITDREGLIIFITEYTRTVEIIEYNKPMVIINAKQVPEFIFSIRFNLPVIYNDMIDFIADYLNNQADIGSRYNNFMYIFNSLISGDPIGDMIRARWSPPTTLWAAAAASRAERLAELRAQRRQLEEAGLWARDLIRIPNWGGEAWRLEAETFRIFNPNENTYLSDEGGVLQTKEDMKQVLSKDGYLMYSLNTLGYPL